MKLQRPPLFVLLILSLWFATIPSVPAAIAQSVSFNASGLSGEGLTNPTSLQFGPDDRLYASQQDGTIHAYTIVRNGPSNYLVTDTEQINLVKGIPNYNDDGTAASYVTNRQVTGLFVAGTSTNPVLYVSSSDYRIGAGGGPDTGLDTNSGIISRLIWTGSNWDKVDIVRGLPRSEENHATNGMQLDSATNMLYVASGGNTNAGAPSNNFAFSTEYALSAAVLSVDLGAIEAMSVQGSGNNKYIYDLPTLDDPDRPNNGPNGGDTNDPFGGNDGLNQAKIVPGGPVQVYASGFRNPYDVLLTKSGKMYTIDNGANQGWGGHPEGDGTANCTNDYNSSEPGSYGTGPGGDDAVNNKDGLHYIIGQGYYGGHPAPVRGNPNGAGLYTHDGGAGVWRTSTSGSNPLPADWPPVSTADAQQCDFKNAGVNDGSLVTFSASTNGIAEYTASNFDGAIKGDLLAASFDGKIYRLELNAGSTSATKETLASSLNIPLDVTAQSDTDVFPGTIWAVTYGGHSITIFEPSDYSGAPPVCLGTHDINLDEDNDNYTNADELDNNTDPCSGADIPPDHDKDNLSDLNDPDDDNDTILDNVDAYARDPNNGLLTNIPLYYPFFNNDPGTGLWGVGFTGLMSNGVTDYSAQYADADTNVVAGGTAGLVTIVDVLDGHADSNDQTHAFQFGINVDSATAPFFVRVEVDSPWFNAAPTGGQLQGMYIGSGDQDNYVKVAVHANSGAGGIQVAVEDNGTITTDTIHPIPDVLSASEANLFISLDPAAGTALPRVQLGNGSVIDLGTPIALGGGLLDALQSSAKALAVGVIGTSKNAPDFTATWDEIEIAYELVTTSADIVASPNQVHFFSQAVNTDSASQPVQVSNPDPATTVVSNVTVTGVNAGDFSTTFSEAIPVASGAQIPIDVLFTPTDMGIRAATLNIEHSGANSPITVALTGEGIPAQMAQDEVLYRINAGGEQLTQTNSIGPDWSADTEETPSPYRTVSGDLFAVETPVSFDSSVPTGTPPDIFLIERWDDGAATDPDSVEMQWSFPITAGTPIEVRLYLAENFLVPENVDLFGPRIFDVMVDGIVPTEYDSIDLYTLVGPKVGMMIPYTTVSDGTLDLIFIHEQQNPIINGIEILDMTPNVPPTLTVPIADVTVDEDSVPTLLDLSGTFTDLEDATLTHVVSSNSNPTLVMPVLNGTMLTLTYAAETSGQSDIKVIAYDSEGASASDTFKVTVQSVNDAPTISVPASVAGDEGQLLTVAISAADVDTGDVLTLAATGLPTGTVFTDNGDGTANISWTPGFTDAGNYAVTVTVTDQGGLSAQGVLNIVVTDVNQPPVFNPLTDETVDEGATQSVMVMATDVDNDIQSLTSSELPSGLVFTDNNNGVGILDISPGFDDAGVFDVIFTATDLANQSSQVTITVTIVDVNQPPTLAAISPQSLNAGDVLSVTVSALDLDGDSMVLSMANAPAGAALTDNGDGTGTIDWTTTINDAGSYTLTLTVADTNNGSASTDVVVNVADGNEAPFIVPLTDLTMNEGESQTIIVTAIDGEGDTVSYANSTIPAPAVMMDNGDGTANITVSPSFDDAGTLLLTIVAADSFGASNRQTMTVQIDDVNRAPVIVDPGNQQGVAGQALGFTVNASDLDAETVTVSATGVPTTATFANVNGQGLFSWVPTSADVGVTTLNVTAVDERGLSSQLSIQITIGNSGSGPIINNVSDTAIIGTSDFVQVFSAVDPDGGALTFSVTGVPTGTVLTNNQDGTATLVWTGSAPNGAYNVTVTVTDPDGLAASTSYMATVTWENKPPEGGGDETVTIPAGQTGSHTVSFVDPDGNPLTLTLVDSTLPAGLSFVDNGNGTGTLSWTSAISFTSYTVEIIATDSAGLSLSKRIELNNDNVSQLYLPLIQ